CAFLAPSGRVLRETLLVRCDVDALASGAILWQARGGAADVDWFISVGENASVPKGSRDVQVQWAQFWGRNHLGRIVGPRGAGSPPSVRCRERLRPGRVEPADLVLDPTYHPDRPELAVGADLSRQGVNPTALPARQARPRS